MPRFLLAVACLFLAARTASAETATVSVGGASITLPAPEGFFRYDGKSAKVDASSQQLTPATNRLLAEFGSEETLAEVLADSLPTLERGFNAQCDRSLEPLAVTQDVFNEMRPVFRTTFAAPSEFDNVVKQIETSVSAATGSNLKNGQVIPLGIFDDTSDSVCFSVLMKEQVASKSYVFIAACSVIRVKNKALYLYATSVYRDKFDIEWARQSVQHWRDTVLQANAR